MTKYVTASDMTSFTQLVTGITALRCMTFVDRSAADFSDKFAVSASPKRRYQTTNQHSFVSQTTNLHTRY